MRQEDLSIADDTVAGAAAIAIHIGKTVRQAFYLCETGRIPAFKLGNIWHLRKSTYAKHIERLENHVGGTAA